jgi:serine/threonine protein kinase
MGESSLMNYVDATASSSPGNAANTNSAGAHSPSSFVEAWSSSSEGEGEEDSDVGHSSNSTNDDDDEESPAFSDSDSESDSESSSSASFDRQSPNTDADAGVASPLFGTTTVTNGSTSSTSKYDHQSHSISSEGMHNRRATTRNRSDNGNENALRGNGNRHGSGDDGDGTESKKDHLSPRTTGTHLKSATRSSRRTNNQRNLGHRRHRHHVAAEDETFWKEAKSALKECCPRACSSNLGLATAVIFWMVCQMYFYLSLFPGGSMVFNDTNKRMNYRGYISKKRYIHPNSLHEEEDMTPEERAILQRHYRQEANEVLGSAAQAPPARDKDGQIITDTMKRYARKKTASRKGKLNEGRERLHEDCEYANWQTLNFPSCNNIHEIDLRIDFQMRKYGTKLPNMGTLTDFSGTENLEEEELEHRNSVIAQHLEGYVSSGMWRNVWRIRADKQDVSSRAKFAVLKLMKMEHDVDERNVDRHRRDALTMERLTHHPNVVDIYGYCGNTVMTEYVGQTLDEILYPPNPYLKKMRNKDNPLQIPASGASRDTQLKRVQLALDAAKGMAALHGDAQILPGGIAHADIQSKQFVVDDSVSPPVVKINDFNRCRFVAVNTTKISHSPPDRGNVDGNACLFQIPSAPGRSRSPEEYNEENLSVQLDVYSLGHIFFGILTGKEPYEAELKGIRKNSIGVRDRVKRGEAPSLFDKVRGVPLFQSEGMGDEAIHYVMDQSYIKDPEDRITAQGIVYYLEPVLRKLLLEASS